MPHTALAELLAIAGLAKPEADRIELRGDDPVLPTRFRIGAAGAAAIAASAIAAAELWALRTGSSRRQNLAVDVRHAAASLRSAFASSVLPVPGGP